MTLKDTKIFEIHGDAYADRELKRIPIHVDRPDRLEVTGLDSVVKLVQHEMDMIENSPIYIQAATEREVRVFTTYDSLLERDELYRAKCDVPAFSEGFRSYDTAMIQLRSKFIPNEDVKYLLDILARITTDSSISSSDNGLSQTVEARQGIQLKANVTLKPRVSLRPYRTFLEVEQPESEFILRLDGEGNVGFLEADGGMWRMQAKAAICKYFEQKLAKDVEIGNVVVMM